ncbi:MAG TPA: GNAT family N-acetyltransferase [Rhodanobacteraceae bacterium]|jgi:ribosomal protein S18 acetylase RimI-like enzyme|nr:GNAT family N-acetyltransferase [Rhodanobacteraceae bacterium]
MTLRIATASLDDLEALVPLFDGYRMFYGQPGDAGRARAFLRERLALRESVILLAREGDAQNVGFVQLYPGFSSVAARRLWILNDLFVRPESRGRGVARALLERADRHAADTGAVRLTLSTGTDNHAAQALYEALGWQRDDDLHYQKPVPAVPE